MQVTWLNPPAAAIKTIEARIGRFRAGGKFAFPWEVGSTKFIDIDAPMGYTVSWQIIESNSVSILHNSPNVVASGIGRVGSVTLGSFTTHTNYSGLVDADGLIIAYDLRVTITNGISTFKRRFRRMIEMTPKTPLESDATFVYNLDSYAGDGFLDFGQADNTAKIVYIKGTKQFSGNGHAVDAIKGFIFAGLKSLNPAYPAHVFFQPGLILQNRSARPNTLKIAQYNQYVFFNGGSDWENPVTLEWGDNAPNNNFTVYIEPFTSAQAPSDGDRNITFMGFKIDGGSTNASFGGGGLTINYPASLGSNTYANWAANSYQDYQGWKFYNLFICNTTDEGNYDLHFQDSDGNPGASHCVLHHLSFSHIGNEALQLGIMRKTECHDCFATDTGYKGTAGQNHLFQINGGNELAFYRNFLQNAPQTSNLQNGQFGNNTYVFANVFVNKTVLAPSNMFFRLEQQSGGSTNYQAVQNTIICPDGTSNVTMFIAKQTAGVTTEYNHLDLCNNLAVSSNATRHGTLNSPSLTNVFGLGLHGGTDIPFYLATAIATPGFVDHANNNYKLASLASPAFTARSTVFTPGHPLMNEDIEGVEFVADVHGAYSGYELMT